MHEPGCAEDLPNSTDQLCWDHAKLYLSHESAVCNVLLPLAECVRYSLHTQCVHHSHTLQQV